MSWEAGVFVLLALALVGGIVWYERAHPPAQIVALVAALAALAVVGRAAFSPIPNVVPTTDIALISGYSLGGGPGFAVGALAALVSNFWLGQGPWTPWQMAGWGMVGVLGAVLAGLTGRRLGRVGLAAVCGLSGFAFGALMDFSLMVTYGGEQSLDRFLALSARGLPFNVAHAMGNAALALVAGPALVRMLTRYRRRFEFAWRAGRRRPGRAAAAGAACVFGAVLLAAAAGGPSDVSAAESSAAEAKSAAKGPQAAVSYLRGAQNADGGFGAGPGEPSSPAMTGWAALGLEAAGVNPADLRGGGKSAVAYLRAAAGEITTTGDLERTMLVLSAAGLNPRRFAKRNLVSRLRARRGGDGSWGGQVNSTAFGILALDAAGRRSGNRSSAQWLVAAQNADGGWGFAPNGATSDADSTGAVLQALAAAGGNRGAIESGVGWLRGAQGAGGGFSLAGGPVNSQSTAWAVQGLIAAGVSPRGLRAGGRSPLDYLASIQAPDGHYRYSGEYDQTPVWVTGQALQAATGQAFPLARVAAAKARKPKGAAAPPGSGGGGEAVPIPATPGAGATGGGGGPGSGAAQGGKLPPAAAGTQTPRAQEQTPPAGEQPSPAEASTDPDLASESGAEDDEDGLPLAEIGAAGFALLVAFGGVWLLRRQG